MKKEENNCDICGTPLGYRQRRFCSKKCRYRSNYLKLIEDNTDRAARNEQMNDYYYERSIERAGREGLKLIKCEICGRQYRQVSNHVFHRHGMTGREYKKLLGKDLGKGILPDDLRELKSWHVFENSTVKNLKKGAKTRYKKGGEGVGVYERSKETMKRLKNLHKLNK